MWLNYLRTAVRNLFKQKLFTFINIIGLTAGITVFLFILMYVKHELSFDQFITQKEHISRLDADDWGILGPVYGPEVVANFPEVLKMVRFSTIQSAQPYVKIGGEYLKLSNLAYADPEVFDLFDFSFIKGEPDDALSDPFSLVLTRSEALRLFGDQEPVGKVLNYRQKYNFTVTGVIEDPVTFHLGFKALGSFDTYASMHKDKDAFLSSYGNWNYPTYLLLEQGVDKIVLQKKINDFFKKRFQEVYNTELDSKFHLRDLSTIYFSNDTKYEIGVKHGNKPFLFLLLSIAVLILAIACINFVNMSTAMAAKRAKEIGLRKIIGARRKQLISQILTESFILVIISFGISLLCMELFLPVFSSLTQSEIVNVMTNKLWLWGVSIGAILFISFAAGGYPALFLTRVEANKVVKGEVTKGKAGARFQKALIIFQFVVSALLLTGTLAIYKQLTFMRDKSLGFDTDKVAYFYGTKDIMQQKEAVKNELLSDACITAVSFAQSPAGTLTWQEAWEYQNNTFQFTFQPVDPDYMKVMGLELLKGDFFNWEQESQIRNAYVINETMMKALNLEDKIGSYLNIGRGEPVLLLGVVKDFHYNSVASPIGPLAMQWRKHGHVVHMRFATHSPDQVKKHVQQVYDRFESEYPMAFHFQRATFDNLYQNQERYLKLFIYAAIIAIVISVMGLFALSLFITQQQTKEIGVRKANGANMQDIIRRFLGNFYWLVLVANIMACPLAWYGINQWLSQFPYAISLSWIYLVVVLFVTLFIATFTVGFQVYRAASLNPADALHYE